jgi:hypothetical protein
MIVSGSSDVILGSLEREEACAALRFATTKPERVGAKRTCAPSSRRRLERTLLL